MKLQMNFNLIDQDISKMALMPPHCPLSPQSYNAFFNNSDKLNGVAPYKLITGTHKRDGHKVQRLKYNNFYTNWKTDSLKWYPSQPGSEKEDDNIGNGYNKVPLDYDKNMEVYEKTKKHLPFATPLDNNGTNQIQILFNNTCNKPTFTYKRYASQPINDKNRFYNPLYIEDISKETQSQKAAYLDQTIQNGMDLYSSVFEDMYILTNNPSDNDNLDYIRKTY